MPVDRLLHPRIGDSEKIARLTDMEFRVWIAYLLAADDYGVLPMTAAKIQGADRTLGNRRKGQVDRALVTLVEVGLVRRFDHQGAAYLFTPRWQTYQRIRYPRQTHWPAPPADALQQCDSNTSELFRKYHGNTPETDPTLARAGTRETANGLWLTANGREGVQGEPTANGSARARFERFWAEFPRKVGKDAAWRVWLQRSPSDDLTDVMIAKVREHRASAQWQRDGGQFIPHPRTWLHQGRWQDGPPEPMTSVSPRTARTLSAAAGILRGES